MLSHSFRTRITSGYLKATDTKEFDAVFEQLRGCVQKTSHPLLLSVLILARQLSEENDEQQREIRRKIRRLEKALSRRYHDEVNLDDKNTTDPDKPDEKKDEESKEERREEPEELPEEINWELDKMNCRLADLQCKAMWKRPQAWQKVVTRLSNAVERFWKMLPEEDKVPELKKLNRELLCSLEFLAAKLEGLENYSHVSQERLNLQRQVVRIFSSFVTSMLDNLLLLGLFCCLCRRAFANASNFTDGQFNEPKGIADKRHHGWTAESSS